MDPPAPASPLARLGGRIECRWRVECGMQLQGMCPEPASPDLMIGSTSGHERPETRPVPEFAKVREFVDHHRLKRFRRCQDQAP